MIYKIVAIIGVILISGCTIDEGTSGHVINEKRFARLKEGVSSKQAVESALGSPSIKSEYNNVWHYISKHVKRNALNKDVIEEYQSIAITFSGDVVKSIKRVKNKKIREVANNPHVTKTAGREMGVMEQLIGNLGRFNENK